MFLRGCSKSPCVGIKNPDPPSPLKKGELEKGGTRNQLLVPLTKGNLGGAGLLIPTEDFSNVILGFLILYFLTLYRSPSKVAART